MAGWGILEGMTPRGFQIGRILRTDIYMDPFLLLLIAFYFFTGGRDRASIIAIYAMALILSVLLHEFGHATAVRRLLKTEPAVLLWPLGGLCMYRDEHNRRTPGRDLVISLAGPAATMALSATFLLLVLVDAGNGHLLVGRFIEAMARINTFLLLLNLLPIIPLDGGHALRAILEMNMQRHRAHVWAARVSVLFAAGALALGLHLGELMIAVLAGFTLIQNLPRARGQL